MKNININIKYSNMDKDHLRRLQIKVNKLMQQSSDDSEQQQDLRPPFLSDTQGDNPETVRKCITLINENRQLKTLLEKQKRKNEKVTQELLKVREQKQQLQKNYQETMLQFRKIDTATTTKDQMRRVLKLQNEAEQWKRKCKQLEQILKLERKKCHKLSNFIRKQVPKMQQTITILTAKVDSKLETHLLKEFDI